MLRYGLILSVAALPCLADVVVPVQMIRPMTVITPDLVTLSDDEKMDGYAAVLDVIGLEARVALYPGRVIRKGDVVPPALVERNAIVPLIYQRGGLIITTEARVLGRAGAGESVRVMNLASRTPLSGIVQPDGSVRVAN